jgi:hypothetical protein
MTMGDFDVVYLVELACLQCGRLLGLLEAPHWPWSGYVRFQPSGDRRCTQVPDWRRLRCLACAGNPYPDGVQTKRVYAPLSRDDLLESRRGRPPKWLSDQRRMERERQSE